MAMLIYIENPNEATKQLLELIKFRKVVRYKINTQKVILSLTLAASLWKTKFFKITPKIIKYLGINLIKDV